MTEHYQGRIHWNKLYAIIQKTGVTGISIYELADQLGVDKNDYELEKTIGQLLRQGKIRSSIGSRKGHVCRVVQCCKVDK